jgi:hypothetical protein
MKKLQTFSVGWNRILPVTFVFPHTGHRCDSVNVIISNGASSVLRSHLRLKLKCLSDIIIEPHDLEFHPTMRFMLLLHHAPSVDLCDVRLTTSRLPRWPFALCKESLIRKVLLRPWYSGYMTPYWMSETSVLAVWLRGRQRNRVQCHLTCKRATSRISISCWQVLSPAAEYNKPLSS